MTNVISNKLRRSTLASQTRVNLDHPGIISTFDDVVVIKIIKRDELTVSTAIYLGT